MTETPPPEIPGNPLDLAILVSDRVQIKNIFITESRFKRDDNDTRFKQAKFRLKYHREVKEFAKRQDNSQIAIKLYFSVSTIKDGEPDLDPFFLIESTFFLIYTLSSFEGIDDEHLLAFAMTNGVYNAWPYWREFVQSTSVRMGLPALVPPVFRFGQVPAPSSSTDKPAD